jgi:hypothetical protein
MPKSYQELKKATDERLRRQGIEPGWRIAGGAEMYRIREKYKRTLIPDDQLTPEQLAKRKNAQAAQKQQVAAQQTAINNRIDKENAASSAKSLAKMNAFLKKHGGTPVKYTPERGMHKKGGSVKAMAKGGSASSRADGCAVRGKTRAGKC